jgi:hypothetical protein
LSNQVIAHGRYAVSTSHGYLCGGDMLLLEGSEHFVDVNEVGGLRENQLCAVTAQTLISTHKGDVIVVFHQTAFLGKVKSILFCLQMKHNGAEINDKSLWIPGGKQRILMDGYQSPLTFRNGLPFLTWRYPTVDK